MLLGLWIIDQFIVPMQIPGIENRGIINIVQVVIGASMVLLWLKAWRWLARKMFWRAIHSGYTINPSKSHDDCSNEGIKLDMVEES
jgi:hypothetical protein